jgi:arsenate reductase
MKYLFLGYPRCSTSQKAKQWLDGQGIEYMERNIATDNPTAAELREWVARSGLPLKRFFNTSGLLYQKMNLKDRLPAMTQEEQIAELAKDGMLVKRPLLIGDDLVFAGFKAEQWEELKRKGILE